MRLISQIERARLNQQGLRVWYLGGNSLVVQSVSGRLYIDPFLIAAGEHNGLFRRRADPPVTASEVRLLDAIAITHEHRDHCNVPTLRSLLRERSLPVIAPRVSAEIVRRADIGADVRIVAAGQSFQIAGLQIDVRPSGDTVAEEAVSYLIRYRSFALYVAGDALFVPELSAGETKLDAAFLPIAVNPPGHDFYPSPSKWAAMAEQLAPRHAVPVHWDLWADYYLDPATLKQHDSQGRLSIVPVGGYLELEHSSWGSADAEP
jgi:L-ascorbate metabolism protein UlaG (beta-lactamase superfamily)